MKHPTKISGYDSIEVVAQKISQLRYDSLKKFFYRLSIELEIQAKSDNKANPKKLAAQLFKATKSLKDVNANMHSIWKISKPLNMRNPVKLKGFKNIELVAVEASLLRYDALKEIVFIIAEALDNKAFFDSETGNKRRSALLYKASKNLKTLHENIYSAWLISKPYMKVA